MPCKFLFSRKMRTRCTRLTHGDGPRRRLNGHTAGIGNQAKPDLPSARQLYIDLREKLGIEERSVLHAVAAIDAETHAKSIETVFGARVPAPCKLKRVPHSRHAHGGATALLKLEIQEAEIEGCIVGDKRRVL